ncbi:MAG: 4Fe-4S dicluster domain-containing protein, partial [Clostridia bacterium]|nr:4Fe-4S dicluster domain-containing protein [Clostridia bacterium]
NCIILNGQATIQKENCLHCGNCIRICPTKAVIRR